MTLFKKQTYYIATALVLGCCVLFFVPSVVGAQGLIDMGGCQGIPGTTDPGCRNVEILLIQAISLIEYLFGIIGTLAFAMFIYGGLKMILSFGSEDKFKEGKEAMVNAVIGMIIAFSAYILVNFVLDVLGVKQDFRAVGQQSDSVSTSTTSTSSCTTSSDCNVGVGNPGQAVCDSGVCVQKCRDQKSGVCGEWNATSCPTPKTFVGGFCPGDSSWTCCVPSPSAIPVP